MMEMWHFLQLKFDFVYIKYFYVTFDIVSNNHHIGSSA